MMAFNKILLTCRNPCFMPRHSIFCRFNSSTSIQSQTAAAEPIEDNIVIPKRIHRGPTDILKALASTIATDPTATHYKYHDDPYLIPVSGVAKRSFALSKESGRKSARFFLENFPHQFFNNPAQPNIEAFLVPEIISEETEVTEDQLKKVIALRQVKNAITAYNNLSKKDVSLSKETKQRFFELLCFYNCQDPVSEDYLEELWFSLPSKDPKRTWLDDSLADQIFLEEPNKDPKMYNTYVLGLLKHHHIKRATEIFDEMKKNNIPVSLQLYNALILTCHFQTENPGTRWNTIKSYMMEMASLDIRPNLETFNSALETLSKCQNWKDLKPTTLQILSEMNNLNIAPSPATYYYIMLIYFGKQAETPPSPVLIEIMESLRGKKVEIQHSKDVLFLVTAMELANTVYRSSLLAHDIHSFYLDNKHLMGNAYNENVYFQHFFRLLLDTEPLDIFYDIYNLYVPNSYSPDSPIFQHLLRKIDLNYAYHYLPSFWSDIVLFNQFKNRKILSYLLEIMSREKYDEKTQESFMAIAANMKEKLDEEMNRPTSIKIEYLLTGPQLGNMLTIFVNGGNFEKAEEIIQELYKVREMLVEYPSKSSLDLACHAFLKNGLILPATKCLEYALSNCDYTQIAHSVNEKLDQYVLSDKEKRKIKAILGTVTKDEIEELV